MFGLEKIFGTPTDFRELVKSGALVLDVRSPAEYQSGHIPNSINIPVEQLEGRTAELAKRNVEIITCCRSGMRSGQAVGILKRAGLRAYNGGPWSSLLNKIA